jgi:CRP-like cAMP-binding protein
MYREWIEVLKTSPIFKGIDPEGLNSMLECLKPRMKQYKQREFVVVCGSPFLGIGILARGKVALTRETYSGNRIIMEILRPTDIFGEMVAFSDSQVWPITVIAQEDCCLFLLPPDKILGNCPNICPAHSVLIKNMLGILSTKALALNTHIEHLSAKSVRGKISSYLIEEYRRTGETIFNIPMKRNEMADYLSIPRPSLSREMSRMRDEGLMEYNRSSIKINNISKLERLIE